MEDNFSPQQSLQLIQSMINKTKENLTENRFYFLLWGWLTFGAVTAQFILKVVLDYKYHYMVWMVTIIGFVITIIYSKSNDKKRQYKTFIGESMGFLWIGIGISFFILSIIISVSIGWLHAWPFFILFYGLGTFISGKIIRFLPFVIGGVICWVLAIAAAFVKYDYQILMAAAAILCSYLIPAYLINSKENSNGRKTNN